MKKLLVLLVLFTIPLLFTGCEPEGCDCDYVAYNKDPTTNNQWEETYRSSWDYCEEGLLDESIFTNHNGVKYYSETYIECE